jgi:DNA-binding MarR family transcriptional regulator
MATLFVVDEADFVYLAQQTGLTAGNMNSHMARLVDGGYVSVEKTFVANRPRTIYQLTEEGRTALQNYRQQVGNLLAQIGTSTPPSTRPYRSLFVSSGLFRGASVRAGAVSARGV